MDDNALLVTGLTKKYQDFTLENLSFSVPKGTIVGLIGENGAGKSTTIHAILGLINKDAGEISILGNSQDQLDKSDRNQIGVVFDGSNFPEILTPVKLNRILKNIYSTWNEPDYFSLLDKLRLPTAKKIKEYSKGMKMKLAIAVALSHQTKLLILDEATSGLDPIMRDEMLDLFLEFVQDENNAILVSSHITSDLEKVADYIVFIHEGKLVFSLPKDELLYQYGIIRCKTKQFESLDQNDLVAFRQREYEWEALISDKETARKKYPDVLIDNATIDEIMMLYIKGEMA